MMVGISPVRRNSPTSLRRRKLTATAIHPPMFLCGVVACVTLVLICVWQTQTNHAVSYHASPRLRATASQFDVIVVGSGLAGLATTLQVLDRGGRVALVEKETSLGGNSLKASSGINSVDLSGDSLEAFNRDTTRSAGELARSLLIRELVDSSAEATRWLRERVGVDLSQVAQLGGHSFARTHRPAQGMVGAELIVHLEQLIRTYTQEGEGHVTIYTHHSVTQLIRHNNHLTGVEVRNGQTNETAVLTAPQVVLATGGFASDRRANSLLGQVRPDLMNFGTTGGSFSTGDGIALATSLGAQTTDLDQIQLHPTGFVDPQSPKDRTKVLAAELLRGVGGLLLDHRGARFCNELGTRDYVTQQMLNAQAKDNVFRLVLTQEAAQQAQKHVDLYHRKGLLTRVHGVQALAEWMKVLHVELLETFRDYQSAMDQGIDEFGKTVFPGFPSSQSSDWDQEVFYVGMVTPSVHYCMGGLTIDVDGRVLNEKGAWIEGLYAAGEVAGGVHGKNRLGGNSLLECTVFGRKVGQQLTLRQSHSADSIPKHHRPPTETTLATNTIVSLEELQRHASKDDLWMALHGVVYNLTVFANQHPGGTSILETMAGTDATEAFATVHSKQLLQQFNAQKSVVMGRLDPAAAESTSTKTARTITRSELKQHATKDDCWVAFYGNVYDMTEFSKVHKGGAYLIQKYAGKDATDTYKVFHKKDKLGLVAPYRVGALVEDGVRTDA